MIPKLAIVRLEDTAENGTFGVLLLRNQAFCWTLELSWRNNQPSISCIPTGLYMLVPRFTWFGSQKHGPTYEIDAVPGRSAILLHPGNVDEDSEGCVLVGETVAKLQGDRAVLNSGKTFRRLMGVLGVTEGIRLQITRLIL